MRKTLLLAFLILAPLGIGAVSPAIAAEAAATKTVTLSVENMTCAACPITVRKALEKVPGVTKTAVSYERQEAVVTFDDTKADIAALIKATTDAGYPSTVKAK